MLTNGQLTEIRARYKIATSTDRNEYKIKADVWHEAYDYYLTDTPALLEHIQEAIDVHAERGHGCGTCNGMGGVYNLYHNHASAEVHVLLDVHKKQLRIRTDITAEDIGNSIEGYIEAHFCPFCGTAIGSIPVLFEEADNA